LEASHSSAPRAEPAADPFRLLCGAVSEDAPARAGVARALADPPTMHAVRQLAASERVTSALHAAVSARFAEHVPKADRMVLATQHEANRRRNKAIDEAVREIAAAAGAMGIEVAALKGVAWIVDEQFAFAAWREMIDVDLLVTPEHFAAMPGVLQKLGYQADSDSARFRVNFHHRPYRRPGVPFTIEIHRHLGWRHDLLDPALVMKDAQRIGDGLLLPAPWCRALHAIIHWQLQDFGMQRGTLPVRDLLEVARFLRLDQVDWRRAMSHAGEVGVLPACEAAIASSSALMNAPVPAAVTIGDTGRQHVLRALGRRDSELETWLATQKWRAGTLWRCEKIAYRLALNGHGPVVRGGMLAVHRFVRRARRTRCRHHRPRRHLVAAELGGSRPRARRCQAYFPGTIAMMSISTSMPGQASWVTLSMVCAGSGASP
jgi:hypothetical protein